MTDGAHSNINTFNETTDMLAQFLSQEDLRAARTAYESETRVATSVAKITRNLGLYLITKGYACRSFS
jgi:hypothetical protein